MYHICNVVKKKYSHLKKVTYLQTAKLYRHILIEDNVSRAAKVIVPHLVVIIVKCDAVFLVQFLQTDRRQVTNAEFETPLGQKFAFGVTFLHLLSLLHISSHILMSYVIVWKSRSLPDTMWCLDAPNGSLPLLDCGSSWHTYPGIVARQSLGDQSPTQ